MNYKPRIPPDTYGAPDRIKLLATGIAVSPFLWALRHNPQLWNQNDGRTLPEDSPHREVDDIWCRFAPVGSGGADVHYAEWYPAEEALPVASYAHDLMNLVGGSALGGILITRVPPGKRVYPHVDPGWHARFYEKFAIQLQAAPKQSFNFENQHLVTEPGDLYWFDNSHEHWVVNDSDTDRITAIFCVRVEK